MQHSTHWRTLNNLSKPTRYSIPEMRGLHLWVRSDLKKYWIFRFTYAGRRHDMSLGFFPAVGLADAKKMALKFRGQLFNDQNPALIRQSERSQRAPARKQMLFKTFAEAYIHRMSPKWSSSKYEHNWSQTIEQFAYPVISSLDMESIKTSHILEILNPIWNSKFVTACRLRGRIEKIISASISAGYRSSPNPATWKNHLENLLPDIKKPATHFNAMPFQKVPEFFLILSQINTLPSLALQFSILNACRVGEAIQAERSQIDGDIWTIPAERMKARREHQIPLTTESLQVIAKASALTFNGPRLFCIEGKRLYSQYMVKLVQSFEPAATVHGFRSAFRDWVSEKTNHSPEVAEMALAHTVRNRVEAAYRRGNLLGKRRLLMEDWTNYCLSKTLED